MAFKGPFQPKPFGDPTLGDTWESIWEGAGQNFNMGIEFIRGSTFLEGQTGNRRTLTSGKGDSQHRLLLMLSKTN